MVEERATTVSTATTVSDAVPEAAAPCDAIKAASIVSLEYSEYEQSVAPSVSVAQSASNTAVRLAAYVEEGAERAGKGRNGESGDHVPMTDTKSSKSGRGRARHDDSEVGSRCGMSTVESQWSALSVSGYSPSEESAYTWREQLEKTAAEHEISCSTGADHEISEKMVAAMAAVRVAEATEVEIFEGLLAAGGPRSWPQSLGTRPGASSPSPTIDAPESKSGGGRRGGEGDARVLRLEQQVAQLQQQLQIASAGASGRHRTACAGSAELARLSARRPGAPSDDGATEVSAYTGFSFGSAALHKAGDSKRDAFDMESMGFMG